MKAILFLSALALAGSALAYDCQKLGRAAVACYEQGQLSMSFDETGEGCGENASVWTIEPSKNKSVKVRELGMNAYTYPGGSAVDSECFVEFVNANNRFCSFDMLISLGSEDGSMDLSRFNCR